MRVVPYHSDYAEVWNDFVEHSKNGTFLLKRHFMDYHAHRFIDCSLLVYKDKELIALFPANFVKEEHTVYSHQGLTYGGLIMGRDITATDVLVTLKEICLWYTQHMHVSTLFYKPIPYIYTQYPSEEDLYALFRMGAVLHTRAASSVVKLDNPLQMRTLRMRGVRKAQQIKLNIQSLSCKDDEAYQTFWNILSQVLRECHGTSPVHTLDEIKLLSSRFPENIKLFVVRGECEILGGCVVFECKKLAHVQYIAASDAGKKEGALDLLFHYLITEYYKDAEYLDFGISTEQGGRILNEGLIFQKEGFGARTVCYDSYRIELNTEVIESI